MFYEYFRGCEAGCIDSFFALGLVSWYSIGIDE